MSHAVDPGVGVTRIAAHVVATDEVGGSTDTCRWFTQAEARELPLVALAERGLALCFDRAG